MAISEPDRPLGNHVFVLSSIHSANEQLQWRTIGYYNDMHREIELTDLATLQRLRIGETMLDEVHARMHPEVVLVTVDAPLTRKQGPPKILSSCRGQRLLD